MKSFWLILLISVAFPLTFSCKTQEKSRLQGDLVTLGAQSKRVYIEGSDIFFVKCTDPKFNDSYFDNIPHEQCNYNNGAEKLGKFYYEKGYLPFLYIEIAREFQLDEGGKALLSQQNYSALEKTLAGRKGQLDALISYKLDENNLSEELRTDFEKLEKTIIPRVKNALKARKYFEDLVKIFDKDYGQPLPTSTKQGQLILLSFAAAEKFRFENDPKEIEIKRLASEKLRKDKENLQKEKEKEVERQRLASEKLRIEKENERERLRIVSENIRIKREACYLANQCAKVERQCVVQCNAYIGPRRLDLVCLQRNRCSEVEGDCRRACF